MCNCFRKIFLIIRILLKRICFCRGEIYWFIINIRWWKELFVNEFGFYFMWVGSVLKWNREKIIGEDFIKLKKNSYYLFVGKNLKNIYFYYSWKLSFFCILIEVYSFYLF